MSPYRTSDLPPPRLSVLDRLLDDEPDYEDVEEQADYEVGLAKLEQAVLRDIRWLLNARNGRSSDFDRTRRVINDPYETTVLRQGLPDLTNLDLMSDSERQYLQRAIGKAIQAYEPRLGSVDVSVLQSEADLGRTRFQITAHLHVDPDPVQLDFDATVVWRSRIVEVAS
jgi:type VI secretion system protein ImpF